MADAGNILPAVEQLGPGSELAGYRIESLIGRGGTVVVGRDRVTVEAAARR